MQTTALRSQCYALRPAEQLAALARVVPRPLPSIYRVVLLWMLAIGWTAAISTGSVLGQELTGNEPPPAPGSAPASAISGDESSATQEPAIVDPTTLTSALQNAAGPEQFSSLLKAGLTLGVLSLAPAILLMTTCYIRVVVVLSLLRQAIGGQNLPPTQVITALAIFVTMLVMTPVWQDIKQDAIDPYTAEEIEWEVAWDKGTQPLMRFMSRQIEMAGNGQDVMLFYEYLPESQQVETPQTYRDVPLQALLPAFIISELKVAFLIGFQVFLPFVVVDLFVSSVNISMGMYMLPPALISLPLKLILFVTVDGWHLIVGMLLQSFAPYAETMA